MSHFAEIKVDFKAKNQADLIAALETIVGKGKVEVCAEPKPLLLWNGNDASKQAAGNGFNAPPCDIIIRRKDLPLKGLTNDMGFKREADGTYSMYADASGWNNKHTDILKQEYAANVTERTLKKNGWITKRQVVDGKLQITGEKP